MDPRLLRYYNEELQHLREMGAEFAQAFPKIAARLRMEGIEVGDPYVERLLEGFAFLASRIQLKLDAEFPRFTERLLEIVYPNYLAPTPSMLMAQLQPSWVTRPGRPAAKVPRGSDAAQPRRRGTHTECRVPHRARRDAVAAGDRVVAYFTHAANLPWPACPNWRKYRAGLRIRLAHHGGAGLLAPDAAGPAPVTAAVWTTLPTSCTNWSAATCWACWCCPTDVARAAQQVLDGDCVAPVGFDDDRRCCRSR
jgi:type VI secretion system protein ImpG